MAMFPSVQLQKAEVGGDEETALKKSNQRDTELVCSLLFSVCVDLHWSTNANISHLFRHSIPWWRNLDPEWTCFHQCNNGEYW